ncbi:uncharacterized protein LOC130648913 [Hydractinia symbiolongicarpus]|uniref:uncharacterized protein LOC130648913 n=1 Tax=Hydractinia symbiolongicarpus TaxID=13093 RepID=UPI002550D01B|nr:uncharacterized protein LOC130648913 [Hydractinia symbiolongicarpus]
MNEYTVKQLHTIAKTRGLTRYSRLRKADLVALLEQPAAPTPPQDVPQRPPRRAGRRNPARPVTILPTPEAMDIFERQEMAKSRSVVKKKMREWYNWLVDTVPEPIKKGVNSAYNTFKNNMMNLYNRVTGATLHGEVEQEVREDHVKDEQQPDQDFTPQEHKHAHHRTFRSFRSFRIPGIDGTDVDGYLGMVRSHVKTLVEKQVKDMGSAKVQCSLWIL